MAASTRPMVLVVVVVVAVVDVEVFVDEVAVDVEVLVDVGVQVVVVTEVLMLVEEVVLVSVLVEVSVVVVAVVVVHVAEVVDVVGTDFVVVVLTVVVDTSSVVVLVVSAPDMAVIGASECPPEGGAAGDGVGEASRKLSQPIDLISQHQTRLPMGQGDVAVSGFLQLYGSLGAGSGGLAVEVACGDRSNSEDVCSKGFVHPTSATSQQYFCLCSDHSSKACIPKHWSFLPGVPAQPRPSWSQHQRFLTTVHTLAQLLCPTRQSNDKSSCGASGALQLNSSEPSGQVRMPSQ
mmetsp:Transcript_41482/g.119631  ORF Transcript_41482/g.119631 Transcript_41482/m.119631 type:complete len:291 (-) Transcript_41482:178-1050(-)